MCVYIILTYYTIIRQQWRKQKNLVKPFDVIGKQKAIQIKNLPKLDGLCISYYIWCMSIEQSIFLFWILLWKSLTALMLAILIPAGNPQLSLSALPYTIALMVIVGSSCCMVCTPLEIANEVPLYILLAMGTQFENNAGRYCIE